MRYEKAGSTPNGRTNQKIKEGENNCRVKLEGEGYPLPMQAKIKSSRCKLEFNRKNE